jgi:hypothetical protein
VDGVIASRRLLGSARPCSHRRIDGTIELLVVAGVER